MDCPDCTRLMVPNFVHLVCEWCTSPIEDLPLFVGYIVLTDERLHSPHYVFEGVQDAKRWKDGNDLVEASIAKALSPRRFRWRKSKGSITGITTANRLYHVAPDHRFDPSDAFVSIAPDGYRTRLMVRRAASRADTEKP